MCQVKVLTNISMVSMSACCLTGQLNFFTKTAVTQEQKVEKSIPRWEITGHAEGYKCVIDQNWGRMAKIGFLDQKLRFWAQKKGFTS